MNQESTTVAGRDPAFAHRMRWVAVLYFIEGFPFGIIWDLWPVFFRTRGVSLKEIGLISLLGIAYTAKPLWAPLVDRYGDRRRWIAVCLFILAATLLLHVTIGQGKPNATVWMILLGFALASATQDIAIDGHTIAFTRREELGPVNGIQVSAYRVALVISGGGFVALAGFLGWRPVFIVGAAGLLVLAFVVLRAPRADEREEERRHLLRPLLQWMTKPASLATFIFILLYKVGDSATGQMTKAFWVDRHMSLQEIGVVSVMVGAGVTVAGALLGGWFIKKRGLIQGLLVLGIAQVIPNLYYALVATLSLGRWAIYGASCLESFGQGMGTTALLTLLMRLCDREHASTQYALLSASFALTRQIASALGGVTAQHYGYTVLFTYSFLLGLPALCLLPWVKKRVAAASP